MFEHRLDSWLCLAKELLGVRFGELRRLATTLNRLLHSLCIRGRLLASAFTPRFVLVGFPQIAGMIEHLGDLFVSRYM